MFTYSDTRICPRSLSVNQNWPP